MLRKLVVKISLLIVVIFCTTKNISKAQSFTSPKELTRILFLLDASQSMGNSWDRGSRMEEAKRVLATLADSLSKLNNVEIGLRVYGHQSDQSMNNCHDTKLEVAFGKNNFRFIRKKLESIHPQGITPIALSLQKCAVDFPKSTVSKNVVVIITDGIESCGGDPCAIAKDLQAKGIILKPFIIGLGMDEKMDNSLDCIGKYDNVPDGKAFEAALHKTVYTILTRTTAESDLLDADKKPVETAVNMTFYDAQTMNLKYDLYHTLNVRGNPDTLILDPIVKYNLDVHTIPPIELNNLILKTDSHNVFKLDSPQGWLRIGSSNKTNVKCLIRKAGTQNTLHVQNLNTIEKYLCGKFDLEILTLPRIKMNNVEVSQTKTTNIQIAPPGNLNLDKNGEIYGGIFYLTENSWVKLYELKTNLYIENLKLQPGNYRIIYRNKANKRMKQTVNKDIVIKSNQTLNVTL